MRAVERLAACHGRGAAANAALRVLEAAAESGAAEHAQSGARPIAGRVGWYAAAHEPERAAAATTAERIVDRSCVTREGVRLAKEGPQVVEMW